MGHGGLDGGKVGQAFVLDSMQLHLKLSRELQQRVLEDTALFLFPSPYANGMKDIVMFPRFFVCMGLGNKKYA